MSQPRRVHVLDIEPGHHYRNTLDGPVFRAVGGKGQLRRAALPGGTIVRMIDTPGYLLYVIPCDEKGNPL